jgi:hypothetical protein
MEERHHSASANLAEARRGAKEYGEQRRKEIRRRVSEDKLRQRLEEESKITQGPGRN